MPNAPSPFPTTPGTGPYIYRGVPNQPFGIIPPSAIPIWHTPHPKIYLILPIKPPPAPPGAKWIPYFFYPLPHRTKITQRIGLIPQFILVEESLPIPTVQPLTINILIIKPKDFVITFNPLNPQMPNIVVYPMPVILKPVDPQLRPLIIKYNLQVIADQARLDQNIKIDIINWNRTHPLPPNPNIVINITVNNSTLVPPIPQPPIIPNPVDNGTVVIPPVNPNNTIPEMVEPQKELIGYDDVCDKWKISVLVNRHFQNSQSWQFNDYTLDQDGNQRICISWKKVPRFKEVDPAQLKKWEEYKRARDEALRKQAEEAQRQKDRLNGKYDDAEYKKWMGKDANITRPELQVQKIQIDVPCANDLDIVLNDRNFDMPKEAKDSVKRKCQIWVNSKLQASDYKKYIEGIRAQQKEKAKANKVRQLAFMQMVPLDYADS